ncbi:hypothetical protein FA13DRAFT_1814910 [Coprinellus micaceus]|uniref:Uncharacterized protein n=1 Tax=Coprinellus micaceus TaxID=71717 RepID=A0A4Y7T6M1_COPMI|nr:hypothetical protein FA13DRAFT_1814910 [Coprinellus micaceus]
MVSMHAALLKNDETGYVSGLLDQLSLRRISPSLEMGGQCKEAKETSLSALWNLLHIFECLFIDHKNPAVVFVRLKYGGLVVERWSDVVHWLLYLLLLFRKNPDERSLPFLCTAALKMLVDAEDKDEWQEDVLHHPQTADLVRTLLCQTEPREGSYHYISDVDGCAILSLLWNASKGQKCFFPALTQLNTVRPRARDKVITRADHLPLFGKCHVGNNSGSMAPDPMSVIPRSATSWVITSLVLRARHIAEIAVGKRHGLGPEFVDEDDLEDKLHCAARSLSTLTVLALNLMSDPALSCIFLKHNIIEYASAFFVLSKGAHSHYMETRGGADGTLSSDPQEARVSQAIWATIAAMLSGSFRTICRKSQNRLIRRLT